MTLILMVFSIRDGHLILFAVEQEKYDNNHNSTRGYGLVQFKKWNMKTDSNYKNVDFSAWIGFENLLCVSKTWDAARARSGN